MAHFLPEKINKRIFEVLSVVKLVNPIECLLSNVFVASKDAAKTPGTFHLPKRFHPIIAPGQLQEF